MVEVSLYCRYLVGRNVQTAREEAGLTNFVSIEKDLLCTCQYVKKEGHSGTVPYSTETHVAALRQ